MATNDYELEEMENSAVKKSENWKKGAAVGAAVLGAGGAVAYGATRVADASSDDIDSEDLLSGAQAGAVEEENLSQTTTSTVEHNTHETIHVIHHVAPETPDDTPDVTLNESAVLYDEEGNPVAQFDAGTVEGHDFVVVDQDLDGIGDTIGIDINDNGTLESNEIHDISRAGWEMGQSDNKTAYIIDHQGEVDKAGDIDIAHRDDDIDDIRNDFHDERTGDEYRDDLAENNPDYRNHEEVDHYSASAEDHGTQEYARNESYPEDYGEPATDYTEPVEDFSEPAAGYQADNYEADDYQADDFSTSADDIVNDADFA